MITKDTVHSMSTPVSILRDCLIDLNEPIQKRTHAAFYLRTNGSPQAVAAIGEALRNKKDSALLRHELAYVLGQIRDCSACSVLTDVLSDETDDSMVRHEAAEALGAIGQKDSIPVLTKYAQDPVAEVADTCKLSLDLIRWNHESKDKEEEGSATTTRLLDKSPYLSVDPAPAASRDLSTEELKHQLLDTSLPLFTRYRAMFSLRNRNTKEAVLALAEGFNDASPLFRHEVAYVMGQMQNPDSIPALEKVLGDSQEHRMVRHEAAEALGAVGGDNCKLILEQFKADVEIVVRESCEVALDTMEYWGDMPTEQPPH